MNNFDICEKYGFTYWQDFLIGRRGSPYPLLPTKKMAVSYEIYGLTRTDTKTTERVSHEVLFDRRYIQYWTEGNKHIIDAVTLVLSKDDGKSVKKSLDFLTLFTEFEQSASITLSSKNPRQAVYLKFKEYVKCQQQ